MPNTFKKKSLNVAVGSALLSIASLPALAASPYTYTVNGSGVTAASFTNIGIVEDVNIRKSMSTVTNVGTITADIDEENQVQVMDTGTSPDAQDIALLISADITSFTNTGDILVDTTATTGTVYDNESFGVLHINNSAAIGSFTNSGTISSLGGVAGVDDSLDGLSVDGASIVTFTNDSSGEIIGGDDGVRISGDGLITTFINDGNITGSDDDGLQLSGTASIGSLVNTGVISGENTGIEINSGTQISTITNALGAVISGEAGIDIDGGDINGDLVNAGTISGSSAAIYIHNEASFTGNIINSGTITDSYSAGIYMSSDATFTGDIVNSGLIKGDEIGLYMSSSVTFTGDIINQGTISGSYGIQSYADITGDIVNSGTIIGDGEDAIALYDGTLTGNIHNTKTGKIIGVDEDAVEIEGGDIDGSIINEGLISATGSPAIYVSSTITGTITNSGTIISDGYALKTPGFVNGGIHNLETGLIHGDISVDNSDVHNAGTIFIPEGDDGWIGEDYSQSETGLLKHTIASAGPDIALDIGGTATFSPNTTLGVDLTTDHTVISGQTIYDFITAGTLVSSTFNVQDNSLALRFTAIDDGSDNIDLTAIATGISTVQDAVETTGTSAARGGDEIIDTIITGSPSGEVAFAFGSLNTKKEVADAAESTLPGASGGVATLTNLSTNAVVSVIASRQDVTRGLSSGDQFMINRHFWLKPFGGWTDQDDRQGVTGYDIDSYGIAAGFDGDVSSWNVGVALAYINSDVESNLAAGSHTIDMDSYMAKVYATKMFDDVTALNLQIGAGISDYDSNRRIFTGDVADADYDSWNVQVSAELERSYQMNEKTVLTPYVHADYSYVDVEDYNESGAGVFNLNVDDDSADSLIIGAGVKGNHAVSDSLLLLAEVGLGYDLMTDRSSLTSSYTGGGAQFTTQGIEPEELVYNVGVGAKFSLTNGTEITARYDVDGRQDYTDQSITANFRFMF